MRLFVMMPFADSFGPVRDSIREAAATTKDMIILADEIGEAGRIDNHIVENIKLADACIVDITDHRPNVIWEMGYAQAIGKEIVVLSQDIKKFGFFDTVTMRTIAYDLNDLDLTLKQVLITMLRNRKFRENHATPEQLAGTEHHRESAHVLAEKKIHDSFYSFFDLIQRAKQHIFIAAQNHFYLYTNPERFKTAIKDFLSVSKNRRLDILMCDPRREFAVRAWIYVNGSKVYREDLRNSSAFFDEFCTWADENGFGDQVRLNKVTFVPLSVTFVDPDSLTGFLVMTPHAYQIISGVRPCFVLSKRNNSDIFSYYWHIYLQRLTHKDG